MHPPKVFLTGVTGYIGGDVFYELNSQHPDWEYAVLVRDAEKAAQVAERYPSVRIVHGDLDDGEIVKRESANADIVINAANSDHEGVAHAIATGLAAGHSPEKPGWWIHTSGTGNLAFADVGADRYGEPSDRVFDDLEGVDELTHLPAHAQHRHVDAIVLAAAEEHADSVRVAIVCPPCIYGPGRGPVNGRSRQIYNLARTALVNKKVYVFGRGLARWNFTHMHDVASLFGLVADAAATNNASTELWGHRNGFFLVDDGGGGEEHAWGDVATWVAEAAVAKGYIPKVETMPLDKETAMGIHGLSWGTNSRGRAKRANKFLGWGVKGRGVREEIPDIVQSEWEILQREGGV